MDEALKAIANQLAGPIFDEILVKAGMGDEIETLTLREKCVGVAIIAHIVDEPELKLRAMELYRAV